MLIKFRSLLNINIGENWCNCVDALVTSTWTGRQSPSWMMEGGDLILFPQHGCFCCRWGQCQYGQTWIYWCKACDNYLIVILMILWLHLLLHRNYPGSKNLLSQGWIQPWPNVGFQQLPTYMQGWGQLTTNFLLYSVSTFDLFFTFMGYIQLRCTKYFVYLDILTLIKYLGQHSVT